MHMQNTTPGDWQVAAPKGTYDVTVAVGDANGLTDSNHLVRAEGTTVVGPFTPTNADRFRTAHGPGEGDRRVPDPVGDRRDQHQDRLRLRRPHHPRPGAGRQLEPEGRAHGRRSRHQPALHRPRSPSPPTPPISAPGRVGQLRRRQRRAEVLHRAGHRQRSGIAHRRGHRHRRRRQHRQRAVDLHHPGAAGFTRPQGVRRRGRPRAHLPAAVQHRPDRGDPSQVLHDHEHRRQRPRRLRA